MQLKTTIKPFVNHLEKTIEIEQYDYSNDHLMSHQKSVLNTKDKVLKDCLISLGWIPPEDRKEILNLLHYILNTNRSDTEINKKANKIWNLLHA